MLLVFLLIKLQKTAVNPQTAPNTDYKTEEEGSNTETGLTEEDQTATTEETRTIQQSNDIANPLKGIEHKEDSVQFEQEVKKLCKANLRCKVPHGIEIDAETDGIKNLEQIFTPSKKNNLCYNALLNYESTKLHDEYFSDNNQSVNTMKESSELYKQEVCVEKMRQKIEILIFNTYFNQLIHLAFLKLTQIRNKINSFSFLQMNNEYFNALVIQFLKNVLKERFIEEEEISDALKTNIIYFVVRSFNLLDQEWNEHIEKISDNNKRVIGELKYYIAFNVKNYERFMITKKKAVSDQKMAKN